MYGNNLLNLEEIAMKQIQETIDELKEMTQDNKPIDLAPSQFNA